MSTRAEKQTKLDKVKDEIIKLSREYNGQFFSNERNRKIIINNIDGMTSTTLNNYLRELKASGFLEGDSDMGRGWVTVKTDIE